MDGDGVERAEKGKHDGAAKETREPSWTKESDMKVWLVDHDIWRRFAALGNEVVIARNGR